MMRILKAAACLVFLAAGVCFAEEGAGPAKTQIVKGTVASIASGNAIEGNVPSITVLQEDGSRVSAVIRSPFNISLSSGLMIRMKDVKEGDAVSLEYLTTKDGVNKAVAIILTEKK